MSENPEGIKKPFAQIREEAKELLRQKGYDDAEAERRVASSLDAANGSDEKIARILHNFEQDAGPKDPEEPVKQKEKPKTSESRTEAKEKEADARDEHVAVNVGEFPEQFAQFKEYFIPEATVGDEAAPLHLAQLVAARIKALETPFDIAGIRTKKLMNEKLVELGLNDEYKTLANEAKRLRSFFADAAKMTEIDPLVIKSRFAHLRDFVEKSEAFHHTLEYSLGSSSVTTEARKERVEDVKESLNDVLEKMNRTESSDSVTKEGERGKDNRAEYLNMVEYDIAVAIPNAFAITTPAEYTKITAMVKEAKRQLAAAEAEDDVSYGMYLHLNDRREGLAKVDALIKEIERRKADLIEEYGGVSSDKSEIKQESKATAAEAPTEAPTTRPEENAKSEAPTSSYEQVKVEWKQARSEWLRVKKEYETELAKYYTEVENRNLWQKLRTTKEEHPSALVALERKYVDEQKRFMGVIRDGLAERAKERGGFKKEKIQSALAGRFVVRASRDQLDLREQAVAANRPAAMRKFNEWYGRNKEKIRTSATLVGAVATLGLMPLARKGLQYTGEHLVGGKAGVAISKSPALFSGAALGAALGAVVGNRGVEYLQTRHRRESAKESERDARAEVSEDNLVSWINDFRHKEGRLRDSERLKKRATVAGAVAGGVAGAYIGGMNGSEIDQIADSGLSIPRPEVETPPEDLPKFEYTTEEPKAAPEVRPAVPNEESPPATVDVPPYAQPTPPSSVPESGFAIPRPEVETPPGDLPKFEYATPEPSETMPRIPRPEVETPSEDLPKFEYAAPTPEIPESSSVTHTVVKGDSVWNILEGKGSDAHPQGGLSEVVRDMSRGDRNRALDTLVDYMEKNEDFTRSVGIASGDPDKLAVGDTIDVGKMDAKLRELLGTTVLPETMDAPPMRPVAEAPGVETPNDPVYESAEGEYVPQTDQQPQHETHASDRVHSVGEMKIEDVLSLHQRVDANDPAALDELERLDMDQRNLQEVVNTIFERGTGSVNGSATVNEWLNMTREAEPASVPPEQPYDPNLREASMTQEIPEPVSAVRDQIVRDVEGTGGFLNDLFGNRTAGTFAKLADVPFSEIQPLMEEGAEDDLAAWLRERDITEAGFEKWMDWIDGQVDRVPANLDMKVGEYVAEVSNQEANAVSA